MNHRPFLDRSNLPAEQSLQSALGSRFPCYKKILDLAHAYSQEWTFTKTSGWMLKIYDRKKALLYLIPLSGGFKISLTLRADERQAFLSDEALVGMHEKIASSKKYPEGFAMQFDLAAPGDEPPVERFVQKLIALRGGSAPQTP